MNNRSIFSSQFDNNAFLQTLLMAVWIAGLSLGFLAARFYGDSLNAYISLACSGSVSFACLLAFNLLPLLISAFAVLFFPEALYGVSFIRGVLLGTMLKCVSITFRTCAGLMGCMLLFSSLISTPVHLWFCIRHISGSLYFLLGDILVCFALCFIICGADAWIVAPFLAEIMIF